MVAPNNNDTLTPNDAGLGPDAHQLFLDNGVIIVRQVFTTEEVDNIRKVFTDQVEKSDNIIDVHDKHIDRSDILARYPRFVQPHRYPDTLAGRIAKEKLVDNRVLDIATNLMGPVYGAQTMFYFKPPTARGQAFHQDNYFLRTHPETCLAGWLAVDEADVETGGLMVIPGSHQHELICPVAADITKSFSPKTVQIPEGLPEPIQTHLLPGDMLFFNGSLIHGSNPNTSKDRFRRSLIFHWIPQTSVEVAKFYQPLIKADGTELEVKAAVGGGPCGNDWEEEK